MKNIKIVKMWRQDQPIDDNHYEFIEEMSDNHYFHKFSLSWSGIKASFYDNSLHNDEDKTDFI